MPVALSAVPALDEALTHDKSSNGAQPTVFSCFTSTYIGKTASSRRNWINVLIVYWTDILQGMVYGLPEGSV